MAIETRKMRKFLNDPSQVVKESLAGLAAAHPDLIRYNAGRRGVGATVLAEKIAGAAAEGGADLAKVTDIVKRVNDRSRSFGVALSSCVPPASGKVIFELPEGQIELGIGIHGEPGRRRAQLASASD